jgi:XTP/dITP diphosphohydrolase
VPLLVATGNPGKLSEFRRLLRGIEILSPQEAGGESLSVPETGATFHDNALLKARAFAEATGLVSLADDSGLQVDALGGGPGVYSARYGGPDLDDAGRCRQLLRDLDGVPADERGARFRCCLVGIAADGRCVAAEGVCEGRILEACRGQGGFGYDPVFWVAEIGRAMAELRADEKDAVSHRGRALRAIQPDLLRVFPEVGAGA